MNILKKGSFVLGSFLCMLVMVGYVNYEYNEEREKNLGRTVYVLANDGEVTRVSRSNDDKNYIFTSSNAHGDIEIVKQNTIKMQELLDSKGYSSFVTYSAEQKKYYIYSNDNITDEIIRDIKSVVNIAESKIIVNKY